MDDAASTPNIDSVCRLCLSPDEPKLSIFDGDDSSVPLSSKIQACLAIQVSLADKLSTLICRGCIKNVNQWHNYRDLCLKAQDKLQQWHVQQMSAQTGVTIKQEPIDLEFENDQVEAITELDDSNHDEENEDDGVTALQIDNEETILIGKDTEKSSKNENQIPTRIRTRSFAIRISPLTLPLLSEKNQTSLSKPYCTVEVKDEPIQEDEYDSTLEIESVTGGEILPNPVAVNLPQEKDRVMEADSTQRSTSTPFRIKRKVRRGPHTHVRHKSIFRKKCVFCQINLHSKYSYARHMERFHSPVSNAEQKDDKTELKCVINEKENSTNTKDQIRHKRNNSQSGNADNIYGVNNTATNSIKKDIDEEMIEDVEEEIDNMDKNPETPLSQVQQNIIGQLKTYSCYSCKQVFPDRRTTLNHLRQHLPDLRPFTCVACLTQFPDRSIYKDHCYTSFECAMKIAIVEPKSGLEKYFTCNMCSKSVANRKELLHHLNTQHCEEQQTKGAVPTSSEKKPAKIGGVSNEKASSSASSAATSSWSDLPGPYENGNPAYNHPCSYCGMIYKHERNLREHDRLCSRLPVSARTSYACIHCRRTFLVFRKFSSHLLQVHNTKDITCAQCRKFFKAAPDFLAHHEKYHKNNIVQPTIKDNGRSSTSFESPLKDWNDFEAEVHANESRISRQKYSCALCGQEFPTRTELGEHRNLHLKVKIYSCVICRSMFSSAGALEIHMKDHGIEDAAEQSAHTSCVEYEGTEDTKDITIKQDLPDSDCEIDEKTCKVCNKSFCSLANMRRHLATVHKNNKNRRKCAECNKYFSKKNSLAQHMRTEHKRPPNSPIKCPVCNQSFANRANYNMHYEAIHAKAVKTEISHACDICGKEFKEEKSLTIHRGWHARRARRLTEDISIMNRNRALLATKTQGDFNNFEIPTEKPARAKKSFPNSPPAKPLLPQLQCQVCDDKFTEVTELRKHLWDIHCARNKSEKNYTTNDLQCELCTHTLPDRPSLERHLEWHMENPILSDSKNGVKRKRYYTPKELRTHPCDICGNFYTSRRSLLRHQKLHVASGVAAVKLQNIVKKQTQFPCNVCHKIFDTSMKLRKHRVRHFVNPAERKRHSVLEKSDFKCELCFKYYSSEVGLRFHLDKICPYRTQASSGPRTKRPRLESEEESEDSDELDPPKLIPNLNSDNKQNFNHPVGWGDKKMVTCSICNKSFLGKSLFYKHRKAMHNKDIFGRAKKRKYATAAAATATTTTTIDENNFGCHICGKEFPGSMNLKMHIAAVHKTAVNNPNTCNICHMTFTTNVGMRNHMQVHSTDSFRCNICQRVFRSRPAVFIHINRQHPDEYDIMQDDKSQLFTEILPKPNTAELNQPISFNCGYCSMSFDSHKGLRVHAVKRHSVRH